MDWMDYRQEFFSQDGVNQIIIADVVLEDWQNILSFLQQTDVSLTFYIDDMESVLPSQIGNIFQDDEHHYLLSLNIDDVILSCVFDRQNEIVLRFEPGQITDKAKATLLFRLMSTFGRRLKKVVLLTKEKNEIQSVFRYEPGQGITYIKLGKKLVPYE